LNDNPMMVGAIVEIAVLIGVLVTLTLLFVRVVSEYERAVIFRLGRCKGEPKGPGIFFIIPGIDRFVRIDTRTVAWEIAEQSVITRDGVSAQVDTVIFYDISDSKKAVIAVEDYEDAVDELAKTIIRSICGGHTLQELLSDEEKVNGEIQKKVAELSLEWGIRIKKVELRDIQIPQEMKRAMGQRAEAEQERQARSTRAQGEVEATAKLIDAANNIAKNPIALEIRRLQTLETIGRENSTIIASGGSGISQDTIAGAIAIAQQQTKDPGTKK